MKEENGRLRSVTAIEPRNFHNQVTRGEGKSKGKWVSASSSQVNEEPSGGVKCPSGDHLTTQGALWMEKKFYDLKLKLKIHLVFIVFNSKATI